MTLEIIFCLFIYLLPTIFSLWANSKIDIKGTDQFYHLLLIKTIKNNDHRFVTTMPNFIGKNTMAYPQLMHWILSYIKKELLLPVSKNIAVFFHLVTPLALGIFVWCMYPYIQNTYDISLYKLFLYTGLMYVLTPYHYDMVNAKNSGISARGLGLLLGQAYLYLIILYVLSFSINYLLVAIPIVIITLLASTFTIQFILFSTPILCLFYKDFTIALPLAISLIVLFLVAPKKMTVFFRGQFNHKYLYAKHLAEKYILQRRFSIWRDFIYDFWVILLDKKKSFFEKIKYITNNSVVVMVISMPVFLYLFVMWYYSQTLLFKTNTFYYLSIPAITCLIIFLLTSFRKTRFLGEPERYLEFAIGPAALMIGIYYQQSQYFLKIMLAYSLLFTVFRFWVYMKALSKDQNVGSRTAIEDIKEYLVKKADGTNKKLKLLCNQTQETKVLFSDKWQIFWHPLFQQKIEGFHFNQLYPESYNYISKDIIPDIIEKCKIDFYIQCEEMPITKNSHTFKSTVELEQNGFRVYHIEHRVAQREGQKI